MVNAYINDRKALATLNNRLLINMNVDDANAIRQEYKDNLTTRSIMQYLEDTYGIMGAQHLALLQQTALKSPTSSAQQIKPMLISSTTTLLLTRTAHPRMRTMSTNPSQNYCISEKDINSTSCAPQHQTSITDS